ncbi:sulfite exporter TauE/SafE family protein [Kineosporia mesophila]|uniref:Probable membrane transporter protein n=1 Tax=Kineosporia mesophila TaxID=566012 RepID=A0ABP7ARU3_9ACTN
MLSLSGTGLLVALVVAAGSVCQVLSGVGFALVVSPLVIVTLGHDPGVRTVLILSVVLNLAVLIRMPGQVRPKDALSLLIPAALAIPLMIAVKDRLSGPAIDVGAGLAILAATAVTAAGRRLPFFEGRSGAVVAGGLSGSLNVLAGAAGPPVALFAAARRWPPAQTSATLQAYSLPLNLLTLIALGLPDTADLGEMAWSAVGLGVGTAVSLPFVHRVPPAVVRWITLLIAAVGGTLLLVTAFT